MRPERLKCALFALDPAWPGQLTIRRFRPELERRIEEHGAKFAEAVE